MRNRNLTRVFTFLVVIPLVSQTALAEDRTQPVYIGTECVRPSDQHPLLWRLKWQPSNCQISDEGDPISAVPDFNDRRQRERFLSRPVSSSSTESRPTAKAANAQGSGPTQSLPKDAPLSFFFNSPNKAR